MIIYLGPDRSKLRALRSIFPDAKLEHIKPKDPIPRISSIAREDVIEGVFVEPDSPANTVSSLRNAFSRTPIIGLYEQDPYEDPGPDNSQEAGLAVLLMSGADGCVSLDRSTTLVGFYNACKESYERAMSPSRLGTGIVSVEGLVLNPLTFQVSYNDRHGHFTVTEFALLIKFAASNGQVHNRYDLLDYIDAENRNERGIDSHVKRLRRKLRKLLGVNPQCIEKVYGEGYRFNPKRMSEVPAPEGQVCMPK